MRRTLAVSIVAALLCGPPAHGAESAVPTAPAAAATAPPPAPAETPPALDLQEAVVRIPVTVKDQYGRQETRQIPITIYRPAGNGPWPLFVFNHGRATPEKRAQEGRYRPEVLARYLVDKGFVVMVPMRIGYAENFGDYDPESSGACNHPHVEPPSIAASDQVLATVNYARTLPYVDASRWLVGGQSMGGTTSIATVGRAPAGLLAGVNFAGGSGGDPEHNPGKPCGPSALTRYWGSLAAHAKVPMLWLYWQNDKYWGPDLPKEWHQAWVQNGGRAEFHQFPPSGEDGHSGLSRDFEHWLPVVDHFLRELGFTRDAIVPRPAPSGYAALADASKVPLSARNKAAYDKFLASPLPRALAVSDKGGYGMSTASAYAWGLALGHCRRWGQTCTLYAVDNDVVYIAPQRN